MDIDYPYDWDDLGEEEIEYPRDISVDAARVAIMAIIDSDRDRVYYIQQLEVFLEKSFFHWITARAISELLYEDILHSDEVQLLGETKVKFVFHKSNRYNRREIKEKIGLIREYSKPEFSGACGRQAEVLFFNALTGRGFVSKGEDTNKYKRKIWTNTNHNLDFIIERDGIAYGAEVKNKLRYIEKDELEIKLEICKYLGIRPLFIMRASPKTYNYMIITQKGFAMIYECQIYPFGTRVMVDEIKGKLSLPVDCPRAIPKGIINRFEKWHVRQRSV
ncbi:MAG: hypothetical protein ABR886_05055 [Dehalococcoidales bacterium]|jgi:hypothetical protein